MPSRRQLLQVRRWSSGVLVPACGEHASFNCGWWWLVTVARAVHQLPLINLVLIYNTNPTTCSS